MRSINLRSSKLLPAGVLGVYCRCLSSWLGEVTLQGSLNCTVDAVVGKRRQCACWDVPLVLCEEEQRSWMRSPFNTEQLRWAGVQVLQEALILRCAHQPSAPKDQKGTMTT